MKSYKINKSKTWLGILAGAALLASTLPSQAAVPLWIYTGQNLTGDSGGLGQNAVYTSGNLTSRLNDKTRSFKLTQGWGVCMGVNDDCIGTSKCWEAVNGDLIVNVMPSSMDNAVSFIRVFPLTANMHKKGMAGNGTVNGTHFSWVFGCDWFYEWSPTVNYTVLAEFVPMPYCNPWWQTDPATFQTMPVANILMYNEPDNTVANGGTAIPVANALNLYGPMLICGLRMGSPVCTQDGFNPWLTDFMSQAKTRGYRVDFLAAHWYGWSVSASSTGAQLASAMASKLTTLRNSCGPNMNVWLTEYNCWGADNTRNEARTVDFINQSAAWFNSTSWMERNAFFHWDGSNHTAFLDAATQTQYSPVGSAYLNQVNPLSTYGGVNNLDL